MTTEQTPLIHYDLGDPMKWLRPVVVACGSSTGTCTTNACDATCPECRVIARIRKDLPPPNEAP